MTERDPGPGETPPQLHIWDAEEREVHVGSVRLEEEGEWSLHVVLEKAGPDLVRGRLCFRRAAERHETAPILVEESEDAVVRRAAALPAAMLRQFLISLRG